jgi:23S rRNA-/tRNA-specific pseudouridylate synthase
MKFINHPVACDSLYNPGQPCPKGLNRLALHAKYIEFKNPKGKVIKIESLLPKEFLKVVK